MTVFPPNDVWAGLTFALNILSTLLTCRSRSEPAPTENKFIFDVSEMWGCLC
jgi:hypothetical protein